jgi:hypothetical protein
VASRLITEGVGRVVAVGAGVKHLKEGDRTLAPFLHPTWAERIKTDARWLRPLPPGDVNQFAMMGVNPPTAYLLLTDIVKLPHGSWVIQSGANSGVGRAIVAIAKSLGLKTINVVRREEVGAEMKALGANARGSNFALLPVLCGAATVEAVRSLAIILVALLLQLSMSAPSAMACSTTACCGPNCSTSAPVNQLSCCKAPAAPDRAVNQAQDARLFDSIGSMPVAAVIIAISHLRNTVVARGYSPPDRLASLALLCSRQI